MVLNLAGDDIPLTVTYNHATYPAYFPGPAVYSTMMSQCSEDDSCSTDSDCCSTVVGPPMAVTLIGSSLVEISFTWETTTTSSSSTVSISTLVPPTTRASADAAASSTSTSSGESWLTVSASFVSSISTSQITLETTPDRQGNNTLSSQILTSSDSATQAVPTLAILPNLARTDDGTRVLSKGALAGIVLGTFTIAILLTVFVLSLLTTRRRMTKQRKARSAQNYSNGNGPASVEKDCSRDHSACWPRSQDRTSGSTAHTLVPPSPSPCEINEPSKQMQRSAVTGQCLPAIHELPAYSDSRRKESPQRWLGHGMLADVSDHTADIETDEAEEAQVGRARVVRIGRSRLAPF